MSWNGVFMAEIQKHECLYNKYSREYRNRELRDECWQKVGEKFDMTPMAAEKKFRTIRTGYGRYLRKKRANPSTIGQDLIPFGFDNCEWLAAHIIHKDSSLNECTSTQLVDSDDDTSPTMSNIEFINTGDYNDETKSTIPTELTEIQTKPLNESTTANQGKQLISVNLTTSRQPQEIELSSTRSLIPKKDLVREEILSNSSIMPQQYLKRKYKEFEDEDELYCRSLVPRLKRLTPQAKAYVRIQLEQLLYHAEFSRETPQIGAPSSLNFTGKTQPTSFLNGRPTDQASNLH